MKAGVTHSSQPTALRGRCEATNAPTTAKAVSQTKSSAPAAPPSLGGVARGSRVPQSVSATPR